MPTRLQDCSRSTSFISPVCLFLVLEATSTTTTTTTAIESHRSLALWSKNEGDRRSALDFHDFSSLRPNELLGRVKWLPRQLSSSAYRQWWSRVRMSVYVCVGVCACMCLCVCLPKQAVNKSCALCVVRGEQNGKRV